MNKTNTLLLLIFGAILIGLTSSYISNCIQITQNNKIIEQNEQELLLLKTKISTINLNKN